MGSAFPAVIYMVKAFAKEDSLLISNGQLGQWASSRVDILPPEVCEVLAKLQTKVKPHSFHATRKAVEEGLGIEKLEDVFEEFDEQPVGVGAVAQVWELHSICLGVWGSDQFAPGSQSSSTSISSNLYAPPLTNLARH